MKKRYLYAFLFGVPGIAVALTAAFVLFGIVGGMFWLVCSASCRPRQSRSHDGYVSFCG